jgi:hypothetical protein
MTHYLVRARYWAMALTGLTTRMSGHLAGFTWPG